MRKRSLIILLVTLLIFISSISIASATYYHNGVGYKDIAEKVFTYHYFNGTIKEKDVDIRGNIIRYLVDVNGTTFYLRYNVHNYKKEFYVGDKVTIYGSAVNHKDNMHEMHSFEFNGKYYTSLKGGRKFPNIYLGGTFDQGIKLAIRRGNSSTTNQASDSMSILNGTIITGSGADDKTKCAIYVGKEYSGKNVKISVLYSSEGENLNKGRKVDKKVSSSGEITVYSKEAFANYPDRAKITIYTHNGKKIDTTIVTLAENSEPQSFDFSNDPKPRKEDPKYASNGAKFVGYAGDGSWANYYKNGHYYTVDGDQID
ncbi:MAG: hypothetical protein IJO32_08000 [Bacilli bacterium]|nr:hypothetical protein [Bacilli bacterium]